ncbi:MAG TPA: hypothetical protein VJ020_10685 [Anaerolineales bacterium]|nr:hypothetical protein [Anaerolineales bacterium]
MSANGLWRGPAAWGNPNGIERERYDRRLGEVMKLLDGKQLSSVGGLTKLGHPRHGLRWNNDELKSEGLWK